MVFWEFAYSFMRDTGDLMKALMCRASRISSAFRIRTRQPVMVQLSPPPATGHFALSSKKTATVLVHAVGSSVLNVAISDHFQAVTREPDWLALDDDLVGGVGIPRPGGCCSKLLASCLAPSPRTGGVPAVPTRPNNLDQRKATPPKKADRVNLGLVSRVGQG